MLTVSQIMFIDQLIAIWQLTNRQSTNFWLQDRMVLHLFGVYWLTFRIVFCVLANDILSEWSLVHNLILFLCALVF